jgi:GNAT superfamily N-acetyltransferase
MIIRNAKHADKVPVLEFCRDTFSWGDYVQDVWDYWFREGNLFVIEKEIPLGICHAFFLDDQVWIEGIRIKHSARCRGLASKLVTYVESIARKKGFRSSCMLIDVENIPSLSMANALGYDILGVWNFYSLVPKLAGHDNVKFDGVSDKTLLSHYVKSWRWLQLNAKTARLLARDNRMVCSDNEGDVSLAVMIDSEHFEKTLVVTLHAGSSNNTCNLISYLQNYGHENKYDRIQILTLDILPELAGLEYMISFNLMQKLLA